MRNREKINKILPILLIILVIVIAVLAIISLGRVLLKSSSNSKDKPLDTSREHLLNTSLSHSVQMTFRGPIVASENFRSYQIVVSPSSRKMMIFQGYLGQLIEEVTLDNNVKAYEEFVYSLDKANYAKGVALSAEKDDTRGICASGSVTEFDILDGEQSIKHLWTSTCKGSSGSLEAYEPQVRNLFLKQIPDHQRLLAVFGRTNQ